MPASCTGLSHLSPCSAAAGTAAIEYAPIVCIRADGTYDSAFVRLLCRACATAIDAQHAIFDRECIGRQRWEEQQDRLWVSSQPSNDP